jgi:hypothetical protein
MRNLNSAAMNKAALADLLSLLKRWLPSGCLKGTEWIALNPRRNDGRLGSFKINVRTGRWADFATGDKGGDVISLLTYLHSISRAEAARFLLNELRGLR